MPSGVWLQLLRAWCRHSITPRRWLLPMQTRCVKSDRNLLNLSHFLLAGTSLLSTSTRDTSTHTHIAVLWPFVWDFPGGPVPEETYTDYWNVLWDSVIILDFMKHGEDNRGKCTDNPAGFHPIRTIDAPTSIIPRFCAGCPSCRNLPNLSWRSALGQLGHQPCPAHAFMMQTDSKLSDYYNIDYSVLLTIAAGAEGNRVREAAGAAQSLYGASVRSVAVCLQLVPCPLCRQSPGHHLPPHLGLVSVWRQQGDDSGISGNAITASVDIA